MLILYGATGYTGRLVTRHLHHQGLRPMLAGRRADALHALADPLGLDVRVGDLDTLLLSDATVLLNCAGPFAATQPSLLNACVTAGVHYLDLAGEVTEHLAAAANHAQARQAGVLVLPGAGFGIVPSDTLSAHVAALQPTATRLDLAIKTVGGLSRGTAGVVLGGLRTPGVQRTDTGLVPTRAGAYRLVVDFQDGDGPVPVVTNPWRADLVAAAPSIPAMRTYMSFPAPVRALMRIPHGGILRQLARRMPEGPSAEALRGGRTAIWARASGPDGSSTAVIHGPDAYLFTAAAAAACLREVLDGNLTPGFQTPATLWGPDFGLGLDGVTRTDQA